MLPPVYHIVVIPHQQARLAYQKLRERLFASFGAVSAYAWEPCIPLLSTLEAPPQQLFLPLAYRKAGDPPPSFRIVGPYAGPEGVYLQIEQHEPWIALSGFCRSRLSEPSSPPPIPPLPYPGVFLCAFEAGMDRKELYALINDYFTGPTSLNSSKLALIESVTVAPEKPWETVRWKTLWSMALRRGGTVQRDT